MYEDFYQLTTNPFRLSPDPEFCFSHSGYASAREYLEYALDQGEGFVMVAGRPGTGKTMLVETFLREVDVSRVVAKRIAVSNYSADELLRAIAYAYEIEVPELDKATLRHSIQRYFLEQEQAGRRVLLILDEAQTLQHSTLEELRILADLQTQSRAVLQLFLVGQESLQELMRTPEMEQFQQRVIANYHLMPLNLLDARAYIQHRLLHAGWNGNPEFTSAAVLSIFQLSKGVPRHINKICNRLLLLGFGKGSNCIDQQDVQAITTEMSEEQLMPMESSPTLPAAKDGINSVPEIRDGLVSLDGLAIRGDKEETRAFAISRASRLAAMKRRQLINRRHADAAARPLHTPSPATPVTDPVGNAPLTGAVTRIPAKHYYSRVMAERLLSRFKWKETFVTLAAILAITTISISALPSIFTKEAGKDTLSQSFDQPQDRPAVVARVPSDSQVEGVVAQVEELPVTGLDVPPSDNNVYSSSEQHPQPVAVPSELVVSVAALEWQREVALDEVVSSNLSPDSQTMADDPVPMTGEGDTDAGDNHQLTVDQLKTAVTMDDELRPVTAETLQTAPVADTTGPVQAVSVADITEPDQAASVAATTEPVQTVSVADTVELTDAARDREIEKLLSLGWQSIGKYRLLTPEDDNAYGYFRAVLSQDPDNKEARDGIQEIIRLYIILARKSVDRNNDDRAKRYITRGLRIQPDNSELLALKESIESSIDKVVIVEGGVPELVSENEVSAVKPASGDDLLSRFTTFLKKQREEAEKGVITVPAGWNN
jgi:type II secretory pathway predicted ATPase ExeA